MTKVLVTGSDGQLGLCIRELTKNIEDSNFTFTDYKELDITNKDLVNAFFKNYKFDYCVNCAAYTAVDKAESEEDLVFNINAEGVKNLSEACKDNETVLIHISTDFVFDGEKDKPYLEEDLPNPINVYGKSKLKGETYVQNILTKYFIIRTSWVYSEYGHNFVKTMLRLAKERKKLSIVDDQIGSPTYAKDLAKAIIYLIKKRIHLFGIYNYTNEGEISWYDFADEIFSIRKLRIQNDPISSIDYSTPAKRPKYSVLDLSKSKNVLNLEVFQWKDSLKECLNKI